MTLLIAPRCIINPSSPAEAPLYEWAPPRTEISNPLVFANAIAAATSADEAQHTMTAGRRSKLPFHSDRAVSYPGSPARITAPATVERRAAMPPLVCWVMARHLLASGSGEPDNGRSATDRNELANGWSARPPIRAQPQ